MKLHENRDEFKEMIIMTARHYKISPSLVEKDYYSTLFLKELSKQNIPVVFKGGLSLAKSYKNINRLSEDIDLNCSNMKNKPTVGMRKKLKEGILAAADATGLKLDESIDRNTIPYKQDYFNYQFFYEPIFKNPNVRPVIQVETSVRSPSFPLIEGKIGSYITDFANEIRQDALAKYGLDNISMLIQSKERTFIDKLFAVADYYLEDMQPYDSRHLYDLHCLTPDIQMDSNFFDLFYEVREIRKTQPNNPSAQSETPLPELLKQVANTDFYINDYNKNTTKMLFEKIPYETVKQTLMQTTNNLETGMLEYEKTSQYLKQQMETKSKELMKRAHGIEMFDIDLSDEYKNASIAFTEIANKEYLSPGILTETINEYKNSNNLLKDELYSFIKNDIGDNDGPGTGR